jgi:hypothetical protein
MQGVSRQILFAILFCEIEGPKASEIRGWVQAPLMSSD